MTGKFNTSNSRMGHGTFGGIIYLSDFDTNHYGSRNMAKRIASDWRFDANCKKSELAREKRMKEGDEIDE